MSPEVDECKPWTGGRADLVQHRGFLGDIEVAGREVQNDVGDGHDALVPGAVIRPLLR